MNSVTSFSLPQSEADDPPLHEHSGSPGGAEEIRWEIVARTYGLAPAKIIAGRLEAEGMPVQTWQEGAGRAFGLTVGILGTGYVLVPKEYAEEARRILAEEPWEENNVDDIEPPEHHS